MPIEATEVRYRIYLKTTEIIEPVNYFASGRQGLINVCRNSYPFLVVAVIPETYVLRDECFQKQVFIFSNKTVLNESRLTLLQLLILFSRLKKFFFKLHSSCSQQPADRLHPSPALKVVELGFDFHDSWFRVSLFWDFVCRN